MQTLEQETIKPRFLMGVEFEGMIRDEIYDSFVSGMQSLGSDKYGEPLIKFGTDSSIKNIPAGYEPVEIRTGIMTYFAGLRFFENMLSFLYDASITEDFLVNSTCGLHINISERLIFPEKKQKLFYANVLQRFDEDMILRLYNRQNCKYCRPSGMRGKTIQDIVKNINKSFGFNPQVDDKFKGAKYMAVSLRNSPEHASYHGPHEEANRIEFRCIGNDNYHLDHDKLTTTMLHIHQVLKESFYATIN